MSGSEDMRIFLAGVISGALKRSLGDMVSIELASTTSGCPMVEVTMGNSVFNVTITNSRKPRNNNV